MISCAEFFFYKSLIFFQVHIASANGYKKVLRLLLKNGADMNVADNLYLTPLHLAAKYNQVNIDYIGTLICHF